MRNFCPLVGEQEFLGKVKEIIYFFRAFVKQSDTFGFQLPRARLLEFGFEEIERMLEPGTHMFFLFHRLFPKGPKKSKAGKNPPRSHFFYKRLAAC